VSSISLFFFFLGKRDDVARTAEVIEREETKTEIETKKKKKKGKLGGYERNWRLGCKSVCCGWKKRGKMKKKG